MRFAVSPTQWTRLPPGRRNRDNTTSFYDLHASSPVDLHHGMNEVVEEASHRPSRIGEEDDRLPGDPEEMTGRRPSDSRRET